MATFKFRSGRAAAEAALQGWKPLQWIETKGHVLAGLKMAPPAPLKCRQAVKAGRQIVGHALEVRVTGWNTEWGMATGKETSDLPWLDAHHEAWRQIIAAVGPRPGEDSPKAEKLLAEARARQRAQILADRQPAPGCRACATDPRGRCGLCVRKALREAGLE